MLDRLGEGEVKSLFAEGVPTVEIEVVPARDPSTFGRDDVMRILQKRIDELEQENASLKQQVEALQAHTRRLDEQVFDMFTISQAGKVFTANPDTARLSEIVLSIIQEKLGIERCALLVSYDGGNHYNVSHQRGLDPAVVGAVRYARTDGLFWHLLANGEPFSVVDIEGKPRFARVFTENQLDRLQSSFWLPLKTKDQVIGILTLGGFQPSDAGLNFLTLLSAQAAVAFETASLYRKVGESTRELDKQMHHLSILYDIGQALNFIDDLNRLLALILDQAIEIVGAQKGSLMLMDEKTDELVVRVVRGIDRVVEEKILNGEIQCTRIRKGEGIAGRVLEKGEPIVIDELQEDGRFKESKESRVDNIMCVPLKVFEECIGVINITNKKFSQKFTEEDLKIISALAGQAAVAINNARLYEMAVTDGLTKLFIRRHLQQRLEEEVRRARRYGHALSICMMDIDHFKQLNDTYGHQAGDLMLVEAARVLRRCARTTDMVARYGGEEFCAVLPETDAEGAKIFAERVVREMSEHRLRYEDTELRTTISIGIASYPSQGDTVEGLLRAADASLYRAKTEGRNRVVSA
ncbi:MAG: diguanylate cyclase [Armatimonadetes bacterium]|nr:diguanylate cyclase [Armatimonadota bacterium]